MLDIVRLHMHTHTHIHIHYKATEYNNYNTIQFNSIQYCIPCTQWRNMWTPSEIHGCFRKRIHKRATGMHAAVLPHAQGSRPGRSQETGLRKGIASYNDLKWSLFDPRKALERQAAQAKASKIPQHLAVFSYKTEWDTTSRDLCQDCTLAIPLMAVFPEPRTRTGVCWCSSSLSTWLIKGFSSAIASFQLRYELHDQEDDPSGHEQYHFVSPASAVAASNSS